MIGKLRGAAFFLERLFVSHALYLSTVFAISEVPDFLSNYHLLRPGVKKLLPPAGTSYRFRIQRIAIFDGSESIPPMEITSGCMPLGVSLGTVTLTAYSPTTVGVRPENATAAALPPMVTDGVAIVFDSGESGAGSPLGVGLST